MANQWFKFYGGEYLSDPKIDRLTIAERSCWITLLCMASMAKNGVVEYLSIEGLLKKSGVDFDPYDNTVWDNTKNVLKKFEDLGMIKVHKNATVTLLNWDKRQEHNLTVAERVAKSRAKKKNVTINVTNVTTEENRIEENRIDKNIDNTISVFEEFWSIYPKKELKKKSKEIWIRKKLDTSLKEIIEFIEKAKATDRWKRGFIKQPPAFLNGECWNDDLSAYGGSRDLKVYKNTNDNMVEKLKAKQLKQNEI